MDMDRLLAEFLLVEQAKGYTADTIRAKERVIEGFVKRIGGDLSGFTEDEVVIYLMSLREGGLCWERVNLALAHLDQFGAFLLKREQLLANPAAQIERVRIRSSAHAGIFSPEQIRRLLKATMESAKYLRDPTQMLRDRAMFELLYSTGIRLGELLGLDLDDVDFYHRELVVRYAKGQSERVVPVGKKAIRALENYVRIREKLVRPGREIEPRALFISREGNRLAVPSMLRVIYRRKVEAGITVRGATHAFRRACATQLLANGAPIEAIARLLGHACLDTTKKYTEVSLEDLRLAHRRAHPRA